ncbi:MAG TPA: MMPL family transporter [Planctomycetota bacterium]|nr:MMPL family transporter [Planctomycetota bacterium]
MARYCRMMALLALVSVVVPAFYLPRLRIDNSIEVWLPRDSADYKRYQSFLKKYGSDEFVIVAARVADPFAPKAIQAQRELAARLRAIEEADKVWDMPGLAAELFPGAANWQDEARKSPFLRRLVLGDDGKSVGIFVWLKDLRGSDARRVAVEKIRTAVSAFSGPDFETHLAGAPRLNVALDRASEHDARIFMPLAIGVCILTLAFMLRSFAGVAAPMCAVGVSAAWTVGLMIMTGHSLNVVTTVMPTLHFVLGLSNGIRLASRYRANLEKADDAHSAVRDTLRELLLPLLFMSLTMAVGFLSLLSSDLEPIKELGLFSAIGLMIAFLSNVLIVPGVLSMLMRRSAGFQPARIIQAPGRLEAGAPARHWSTRWALLSANHPLTAIAAALLALAACAALLPTLKTESNVLKFFPDDSEVARDYRFVGENLTGFYTVELDVACDESFGSLALEGIKALDKDIRGVPGVVRVDHLGTSDRLPKSAVAGALLSGLTERFYHEDEKEVSFRVCVLVNAMGSSEFYPLLKHIRESAARRIPNEARVELTGVVALLNDAQSALIGTQIKSFASAFGIVVLMMGLLFLSPRAALASILPNLLPIMLTFAGMALCGIHLDAATVMIASVAIGIAVDNTIYFLARYRDEMRAGADSLRAVENTFESIGRPVAYTSAVAAAGFAILAFAQFRPLIYFGVLTGLTMLTALAGTILLAPACVRALKVWQR